MGASSGSAVRLMLAFHSVEQPEVCLERIEHRQMRQTGAFGAARTARETVAKLERASRLRRRHEPADERAKHGDGRRRDAGNPQRLAERVRADLRQALNDFA